MTDTKIHIGGDEVFPGHESGFDTSTEQGLVGALLWASYMQTASANDQVITSLDRQRKRLQAEVDALREIAYALDDARRAQRDADEALLNYKSGAWIPSEDGG